jgi:hypothetical protein
VTKNVTPLAFGKFSNEQRKIWGPKVWDYAMSKIARLTHGGSLKTPVTTRSSC